MNIVETLGAPSSYRDRKYPVKLLFMAGWNGST
jgi:hypothetical protein